MGTNGHERFPSPLKCSKCRELTAFIDERPEVTWTSDTIKALEREGHVCLSGGGTIPEEHPSPLTSLFPPVLQDEDEGEGEEDDDEAETALPASASRRRRLIPSYLARVREWIFDIFMSREVWYMMTLTFERDASLCIKDRYESLHVAWKSFIGDLRNAFADLDYLAVIEEHRSGLPHVNLVIHNSVFHRAYSHPIRICPLIEGLQRLAIQCGFGRRLYLEPVRNRAALSRYLAKGNQFPWNGPHHHRRFRVSRSFPALNVSKTPH